MRRKTYANDRTKRMEENPEKEKELREATNAKRRSQRAASKALESVQKLAEVADKVQNNMRTCIVKISDNLTSKSIRLAEEKRLAETAMSLDDYTSTLYLPIFLFFFLY